MVDCLKLQEEKKQLRKSMFHIRKQAFKAEKNANLRLSEVYNLLRVSLSQAGFLKSGTTSVIAGYYPIYTEIDCQLLLQSFEKENHTVCLPVIQEQGQGLVFKEYITGQPLVKGAYDIPQPHDNCSILEPDIVLVPLLAFDANGYRLGYGGGFYDRTLQILRAKKKIAAIGLAFSQQYVETIPLGRYDVALDAVLTPQKLHNYSFIL